MTTPYRIELLGGLRVWCGEWLIDRFPTVKSALLLAYLAAAASSSRLHRAPSRDQLVDIFWPDALPARARASLCNALWLLRQLLAVKGSRVPLFLTDRAAVALNPAYFRVDVVEFEGMLRTAEHSNDTKERQRRLAEALGLYRGELLAGYADTWLLAERVALAESYFTTLRRHLGLLAAGGELEVAIVWAREGLRQDPLREELHRDLIRLLAMAGEPEAAIRQYRELTRLLQAELNSSPCATTCALARGIQRRLVRRVSPAVRRRATRLAYVDRPPHIPPDG